MMLNTRFTDQRGIILITALGLIVITGMVGGIASFIATTNRQIGGNDLRAKRAFYAAEAGTEEARARLRFSAGANRIVDNAPASGDWVSFIGDADKARLLAGYEPENSEHTLLDSLQSGIDYTVAVRHKLQGGDVLYWGDPDADGVNTFNTVGGENVYVITGYGFAGAATREIEIEAYHLPPPPAPAAVYMEALMEDLVDFVPPVIMGPSIRGADQYNPALEPCGETAVPGITTPLPESLTLLPQEQNLLQIEIPSIVQLGATIEGHPDILYEAPDINVHALIDTYKDFANFQYNLVSAVLSGPILLNQGDDWGTPTPGATPADPSTCDVANVVYFDTLATFIKLTGGVTGCGILLVDGTLIVAGGFSWYGVIMTTGPIIYAGGVGNMQVTGAVITESSADMVSVGGNANIVYCSSAIRNTTFNQPLVTMNWKERLD